MNHYVYEITNLVNGKKYIGKRSCKSTIEEDKYMGSGKLIKKAHKKYGINNFKKEILEICESEKIAFEREKFYIDKVKAYSNDKYYNISSGGEGGFANFAGKSQEELELWKKRMSESRKGRVITEEWKQKILDTRKLKGIGRGSSNPMYGKKGRDNPTSKSILMMDLKGNTIREFECIREANDYFKNPKSSTLISKVCIDGGTAYNYLWLFKEEYDALINENKFEEWYLQIKNRYIDRNIKAKRSKVQNNSKKVYQLNKDTLEIIQEFDSIILASENTNIKTQSISRVCRHGCNTAGGYSWIYKEEYHSITKEELIKLYSHKYKKPSKECYSKNKVKVVCLNTLDVFDGIVDAIHYFNLCKGAKIDAACRGVRKSVGKHPETNEPLKWMYYDDYLKQQEGIKFKQIKE